MKRLDINITEIKINGKPADLYEVVTNLDRRIETLANETSAIRTVLFRYMNSNAGKQYELATTTVYKLSIELNKSAEIINDLQRQICGFVEKCNTYDLRHDASVAPRRLNIQPVKVPTNVAKVEYNELEMTRALSSLNKYVQNTKSAETCIMGDKNNIGSIWRDRQYQDFSTEIDQLVATIKKDILVLEDYNKFLDMRIRALRG